MTRPAPIVIVAAGYGAGLMTGLAHFGAPTFVAMVTLIAGIGLTRNWYAPALFAGAVAIVVGHAAKTRSEASCAARLVPGDIRLRMRTDDPGVGTGSAALIGRHCSGKITVRWQPSAGLVAAGATVDVSGEWRGARDSFGRPGGVLRIDHATVLRLDATLVERTRTALVRSALSLFESRAPIAIAMLTGWRGALPRAERDAFAGAGMIHLLTFSGLQIAWIAGWIILLLRTAGVRPDLARVTGAALAVAYVGVLGWPTAALRAGALLFVVVVARLAQRQIRVDALLGLSALIVMVLDPWSVASAGFWLSISGVTGVVVATRWCRHAIGRGEMVRALAASLGACVATAPIAAGSFGFVSPAAIGMNLLAAGILALALPAVLGAILLHGIAPPLAGGFVATANLVLAALPALAGAVSRLMPSPGATSSPWMVAGWTSAAIVAFWAIRGRATWRMALRRVAWPVTLVVAVSAFAPRPPSGSAGELTLTFADVGQGDGAVLRTPGGHWVEIDAGPDEDGFDAGARVMVPLLEHRGARRVDLFVLSHAHRDHVGGGVSVLRALPVSLVAEPGELFSDHAYEQWLAALGAQRVRWHPVRAGATWQIDGVHFTVLHPPVVWPHEGENLNEDSIVLLVQYGDFRALLMGDAGHVAEAAMQGTLPPVNLLKVGHHGSAGASSAGFLATIRPQVAVISVGRHNPYGHPAPQTLVSLSQIGAMTFRTDVDGAVTVTTDGHRFTVNGTERRATFDASR